jgi:hypothetical protein
LTFSAIKSHQNALANQHALQPATAPITVNIILPF